MRPSAAALQNTVSGVCAFHGRLSPVPRYLSLHLYVDVNTCGHFKTLKSIHRLLVGSDDIDQSLVCSLLELLTPLT